MTEKTPEKEASRIIKALYCPKQIRCDQCDHFIFNCAGRPQSQL